MTPEEIKAHRTAVQQSFKAAGHETLHLLKYSEGKGREDLHCDEIRVIVHTHMRAARSLMALNAAFVAAEKELIKKRVLIVA